MLPTPRHECHSRKDSSEGMSRTAVRELAPDSIWGRDPGLDPGAVAARGLSFDTEGRPLWVGRASRDANAAQRLALAARDGGCVGCGARHNTYQPHHEQHWRHGGGTDIDNLCLLCGPCHHHEIHRLGGDIATTPDGGRTLRRAPRRPPGGAGGSQPPGTHTHHRRRGPAQPATNQPLRL